MQSNQLPPDHVERMDRVRLALDGLSIGDAFGGQFFIPANHRFLEMVGRAPAPPWRYTDDTEMALGIAEVLEDIGHIDQERLAQVFALRYDRNMYRGYGAGAHQILSAIHRKKSWRKASSEAFGGMGSLGNGAAMRVAPIGAYFADDVEKVVEQARLSAEVTHLHPEGIAGGIAIAVATAYAYRHRADAKSDTVKRGLIDEVLAHTPEGETRYGIAHASAIELELSIETAARLLGNGIKITAMDTVPFTLWVASRHLDSYTNALWNTISAGGDVDTTGAIVGGIVVMATGREGIPSDWLDFREDLQFRVK